jgi:hypothetical protein
MSGALHFDVSSFGTSKWKLFISQSIHGLCKRKQDNPMMIEFVKDEITLKTTLLVCNPMIIFNALVSCVVSFEKKPLITMNIVFFTRVSLNYRTNFLSMKHLDAPKSSNVLTFIIVDLLHLIVINKEKQSLEFKYKLGQFFIA